MKVKLIPAEDVWQIIPLEGRLHNQAVASAEALGVNGCRLHADGTIDGKYLAASHGLEADPIAYTDPSTFRELGIGKSFYPAKQRLHYDPDKKVWYDADTFEVRKWVYRVSVMGGNVYYTMTKEEACTSDWRDSPAFDASPVTEEKGPVPRMKFIQKVKSLVFSE